VALREDLELDVGPALSRVGEVEAALTNAAQAFKVALADALGALEIDTGSITGEIDAAVAAADTDVIIEGDAAEITGQIDDAVADADVTVDVDADTAPAEAEIDGLEGQTVTVEVDADTADAEAALDGLTGAVGGFGEQAQETGDATGALNVGIAGMSGSALAAVGGVAALTGGIKTLFDGALAFEGSAQAFNLRLGESADVIETLDVTGLNETLGDLVQRLGSSDEAVRDAAASLFELGVSSGTARGEVEQTTQQVLALALRATALNPALGDAGQATTTLSSALARGGRSLGRFGIDLSAADIQTRALADTQKSSTIELTQYELAAAGAALATEKLGDTLGDDINAGAENSIIQFRRLEQVFGDTLELIGQPLIVPVLELFEASIPAVTGLFQILGDAAGAILPVFSTLLEALSPIITAVGNELGPAFAELGPIVGDLAVLVAPLLASFADFIPILRPFLTGFVGIAGAAVELLDVLSPFISVLLAVKIAVLAMNVALAANPVLLLTTAVAGAVGVLSGLVGGSKDATDQQEDLAQATDRTAQAFGAEATTADELADSYSKLNDNFADFLLTQSTFADNDDALNALSEIGLGVDELRDLLDNGEEGFKDFTAAAIEAGELTLEIDGVEATADEVANLDGSLSDLVNSGGAAVTSGRDVAQAFNDQQVASERAADATLRNARITGSFTAEQIDTATAIASANDGYVTQAEVVRILATDLDAVNAEIDANSASLEVQVATLGQNAQSWVTLSAAILDGSVTAADFESVADTLGVSVEQVTGFADNLTGALDSFVTAGLAGLPQVGDAFLDLNEDGKTTLAEFRKTLDEQTAAIAEFPATVSALLAFGFDDLAALAIERGPEFAAQIASEIAAGGPEIAIATETALEGNREAITAQEVYLREVAGPALLGATTAAATDAAAGFDEPLDFGGTITAEAQAAQSAMLAANPELVAAAAFAGVSVEEAYGLLNLAEPTTAAVDAAGVALDNGVPALTADAATAGADVSAGFEGAADFEAGVRRNIALGRVGFDATSTILTPFAIIAGQNVGEAFDDGIALGIITNASVVREAARNIVRQAEAAATNEAGIASPSRLFADLVGAPIAEGIAVGIDAEAASVIDAAEAIVRGAARAAGATSLDGVGAATVRGVAGATAGGAGSVSIGSVQVDVQVVGSISDGQARAVGASIVAGLEGELTSRQIAFDTRTG